MKQPTRIILAAVVAIVVIVGAIWLWIGREIPEAQEDFDYVFDRRLEPITHLAIEPKQGQRVEFTRDGKDWRMIEPSESYADDQAVGELADVLRDLEYVRTAGPGDFGKAGPNVTGLDEPRWTVHLKTTAGENWTLYVGNRAPPPPMDGAVYVVSEQGPQIPMIARNRIEQLLDRDRDRWRPGEANNPQPETQAQ
ncbi:MAG: DUF4340 domain-containing protein [Planctomycetota bacterium]